MGLVVRQDGVLKYISKGVDASQELVDGEYEWRENHLDQPTASQQPRLVGGIAPNSKVAASNQNGESRYFTHPEISFDADEAWSVSFCVNWNGCKTGQYQSVFGRSVAERTKLDIEGMGDGTQQFRFTNSTETALSADFTGSLGRLFLGKNNIGHLIADGIGNISLYIGGVLKQTVVFPTPATFSAIIRGYGFESGRELFGEYNYHRIQSGALTPTQVTAEYNLLRSMYPEIESVDIGTQTWATRNFEAVCTPTGNVIANVTENGAVEKVTNAADREFSSDTGWWMKEIGWSIGSGKATFNASSGGKSLYKAGLLTVGKWYRVSIEILDLTMGAVIFAGFSATAMSSNGVKTFVLKATSAFFGVYTSSSTFFNGSIDNISCQELNWSNATEIYDAVYAATVGDAATKEYAALKEAAMWRYPNNDVNKGAWGGKLYNKYAMMLLSLDMASANFGYHIPTNAEVAELLAQVGGDTNKLKYVGLDYWNDAIGTNESGLTLLGTGVITPGGVYTGEKELTGFWTSDSNEFPTSGLPIRIVKNV